MVGTGPQFLIPAASPHVEGCLIVVFRDRKPLRVGTRVAGAVHMITTRVREEMTPGLRRTEPFPISQAQRFPQRREPPSRCSGNLVPGVKGALCVSSSSTGSGLSFQGLSPHA